MNRRPLQLAVAMGLLSAGFSAGRALRFPIQQDSQYARHLSESYQSVAQNVSPAVVSVRTLTRRANQNVLMQQGSGVFLTDDGVLVTNSHVVAGGTSFEVVLNDGRKLEAILVGTDRETDLAVLKVEADGIIAAKLANSEHSHVGEIVLAMGNPYGFGHTVTAGIISGKGRRDLNIATYEDFLQTDAAINPGNSGGPLVNLLGEVVGINTAVALRGDVSNGLGFAIPSYMVEDVVRQLLEDGHVSRGWLGIDPAVLTEEGARQLEIVGPERVIIDEVIANSPAAAAGLRRNDIVLKIGETRIASEQDLFDTIAKIGPGNSVPIEVRRRGKLLTLKVTLEERTYAKAVRR